MIFSLVYLISMEFIILMIIETVSLILIQCHSILVCKTILFLKFNKAIIVHSNLLLSHASFH